MPTGGHYSLVWVTKGRGRSFWAKVAKWGLVELIGSQLDSVGITGDLLGVSGIRCAKHMHPINSIINPNPALLSNFERSLKPVHNELTLF